MRWTSRFIFSLLTMKTSFNNADQTLAMVFPGQGSQSVGMLSGLAQDFPLVSETYREASDTLGYDLWKLVMEGPAEELNLDRPDAACDARGGCGRVAHLAGARR